MPSQHITWVYGTRVTCKTRSSWTRVPNLQMMTKCRTMHLMRVCYCVRPVSSYWAYRVVGLTTYFFLWVNEYPTMGSSLRQRFRPTKIVDQTDRTPSLLSVLPFSLFFAFLYQVSNPFPSYLSSIYSLPLVGQQWLFSVNPCASGARLDYSW